MLRIFLQVGPYNARKMFGGLIVIDGLLPKTRGGKHIGIVALHDGRLRRQSGSVDSQRQGFLGMSQLFLLLGTADFDESRSERDVKPSLIYVDSALNYGDGFHSTKGIVGIEAFITELDAFHLTVADQHSAFHHGRHVHRHGEPPERSRCRQAMAGDVVVGGRHRAVAKYANQQSVM